MPSVALSKSAAQTLIKQYSSVIDNNMKGDCALDLIIQRLEAKLAQLEAIAMDAYSILGVQGNTVQAKEAVLKKKIKDLQLETQALNSVNLQSAFLEALKATKGFQLDLEEQYEVIRQSFIQAADSVLTESDVATELLREIMPQNESIKITVDLTTGTARVASGKRKGQYAVNLNKSFSKLSKEAKNTVNKYLTSKKGEQRLLEARIANESIGAQSLSMEYILEQVPLEAMLKMSAEERKRVFEKYPQLKDSINRNFIKQIMNACPSANKRILQNSIEEVLSKKPLAFFIGGNIEGMTGILGEIQALYYFKSLLGNKGGNVSWIGGLNNPHADLLLVEGLKQFGIQVKNTSRQAAELEVSFQTFGAKAGRTIGNPGAIWEYANTDEALNSLSIIGLSGDLSEAIQTFLAMEGFNIYYNWDSSSGRAKAVDMNERFQEEREQIELYAEKAQQIASLVSVSMMYMQETNFSGGASNTLYLIGGSTLISAASILSDIIAKLKANLIAFKTKVEGHSVSKDRKGAKTIVDVINHKGRLADTKFMFQSAYNFDL